MKIVLPIDESRLQQLRDKCAEYRARVDPSVEPKDQMSALCKRTVLLNLLLKGEVETDEIRERMRKVHGDTFDAKAFANACGVIDDYCRTGGVNVRGGTSLAGGRTQNAAVRAAFEDIARKVLGD